MNRNSTIFAAALSLVAAGMMAVVSAQPSPAPDAERVARVYLRAFFGGDVKTAANLMDPRTLERIRETFLGELVNVTDPDSEKAILSNLGLAATTAVLLAVKAWQVTETASSIRPLVGDHDQESLLRFRAHLRNHCIPAKSISRGVDNPNREGGRY